MTYRLAAKGQTDPHYCEVVTADAGKIGEGYLKQFQNNENTIPTILTTSEKLSTGVNAVNIRSIVRFRNVNSMVAFKMKKYAIISFQFARKASNETV